MPKQVRPIFADNWYGGVSGDELRKEMQRLYTYLRILEHHLDISLEDLDEPPMDPPPVFPPPPEPGPSPDPNVVFFNGGIVTYASQPVTWTE